MVQTPRKFNIKFKSAARGVTLIELMIAMLILSILVNFAMAYYSDVRTDAINAKIKSDLNGLKAALVNYISDSANIAHERPAAFNQLEYMTFSSTESGEVKVVKRNYIEKIPSNPWGVPYYADLYYIYARNSESQQVIKVPYSNPNADSFATGKYSSKFYTVAGSGSVGVTTGEVTLTASKGVGGSVVFFNKSPLGISPLPTVEDAKKAQIFEFTFKYVQTMSDEPMMNTNESRIIDVSSSTPELVKTDTGMIFLFKEMPAPANEPSLMSKSGMGFKFSATGWELYHSPDGGAMKKLSSGGLADGIHSIRFSFDKSNSAKCYLDGDMKVPLWQFCPSCKKMVLKKEIEANVEKNNGAWKCNGTNCVYTFNSSDMDKFTDYAMLGMAGTVNNVYFAVSPCMFSEATITDSKLSLYQIVLTSVDFSTFYPEVKIMKR